MAIDTSNNLNALTSAYLTATAVNSAVAATSTANNPSSTSVNQAALQNAVNLAADASVVVSLSNANLLAQQPLTYNASGLLNPAGLLNTAVALNTANTVAQTIATSQAQAAQAAAQQAAEDQAAQEASDAQAAQEAADAQAAQDAADAQAAQDAADAQAAQDTADAQAAQDAADAQAATEAAQSGNTTATTAANAGLNANEASGVFYAGVLSGLAAAPSSTASLYDVSGGYAGIDTTYALQLAQVLQANPDLADTISRDISAQGVTGALLSVTA
ncbi:hypothetical protein [Herbaspirillum robiniae]|uniref:Uncharacterized protein n=1 Tax=Herbaspirillum robiniae TaxID=2014887 RepID=A0A2D0B5I7_9BURK|nr:hypothetical protein [Herbaspirillum robiniae]OWY29569.1 hypothetical protein CEJ42_06785 [Herbaspirillum robiniae]